MSQRQKLSIKSNEPVKFKAKNVIKSGSSSKYTSSKISGQINTPKYSKINNQKNQKILHHSVRRNFDPEGNAIITTKIVREIDSEKGGKNLYSRSIMNARQNERNISYGINNELDNRYKHCSSYSNVDDNNQEIKYHENYEMFSPCSYGTQYKKVQKYSEFRDGGIRYDDNRRSPMREEMSQMMPNYVRTNEYYGRSNRGYMTANLNINQSKDYNIESPYNLSKYSQSNEFNSPDRQFEQNSKYFRSVQIDKIKGKQPIIHEKVNNQFESPIDYNQYPEGEDELYEIVDSMATLIQSCVRGYLVRKKVLRYITLAIYYQTFCDKLQDILCIHARKQVFDMLKNKLIKNNNQNKYGTKYINNINYRMNKQDNVTDGKLQKSKSYYSSIKSETKYNMVPSHLNNTNNNITQNRYNKYISYRNTPLKGIGNGYTETFESRKITNLKNLRKEASYQNYSTFNKYKRNEKSHSPSSRVIHYFVNSPCTSKAPHQRYYHEINTQTTNVKIYGEDQLNNHRRCNRCEEIRRMKKQEKFYITTTEERREEESYKHEKIKYNQSSHDIFTQKKNIENDNYISLNILNIEGKEGRSKSNNKISKVESINIKKSKNQKTEKEIEEEINRRVKITIIEREKIEKERRIKEEEARKERERIQKEKEKERERERKEREEKIRKEKMEREEKIRKEKEEQMRIQKEKEKERERERKEREEKIRKEKWEREERIRREKEEQMRIQKEKEKERERERERKEREERIRKEKLEREERKRKEKEEKMRIQKEKEKERKEREEKMKKERLEKEERIRKEREEKIKREKEERMKKEEQIRIEKEKQRKLKEEQMRIEKEKREKEKERLRLEQEEIRKKKITTNIKTIKMQEEKKINMNDYILKKDCQKNLENMKSKLEKEYEKKIEMEKKRGLEEKKRYEEKIEINNRKEIEKIIEEQKRKEIERKREIEREKENQKRKEIELEKQREKEIKLGIKQEMEKQKELMKQKELEEKNKKMKQMKINKAGEINLKSLIPNSLSAKKTDEKIIEKNKEKALKLLKKFILFRGNHLLKLRKYFNDWRLNVQNLILQELAKAIQDFCRTNLEISQIKRVIENWKKLGRKIYYKKRIELLKKRPKIKINIKMKKLYELIRITKLNRAFSRRRFIHYIILIWYIYAKNVHKKRVNMKFLYENLLRTYMSLAKDIFGNNQCENPSVQDAMYEAVNTNKFSTGYADDVPLARKHYEEMRRKKLLEAKNKGEYSTNTSKLEIEKKEIRKTYYSREKIETEDNDDDLSIEAKRKRELLNKFRKYRSMNRDLILRKKNRYIASIEKNYNTEENEDKISEKNYSKNYENKENKIITNTRNNSGDSKYSKYQTEKESYDNSIGNKYNNYNKGKEQKNIEIKKYKKVTEESKYSTANYPLKKNKSETKDISIKSNVYNNTSKYTANNQNITSQKYTTTSKPTTSININVKNYSNTNTINTKITPSYGYKKTEVTKTTYTKEESKPYTTKITTTKTETTSNNNNAIKKNNISIVTSSYVGKNNTNNKSSYIIQNKNINTEGNINDKKNESKYVKIDRKVEIKSGRSVNKDKQNEKKIFPTKSFQITRTNQ